MQHIAQAKAKVTHSLLAPDDLICCN